MISAGEWNGDLVAACTVQCGLMFEASGSPATALQVMRHGTSHDPAEMAKRAFDIFGHKVDDMPLMA